MVLLPDVAVLALALFCLAVALAAAVIVDVLIQEMGGVPVIGRVITEILKPIAHALSWAAGKLEAGVDALVGYTWHLLAKMLDYFLDGYLEYSRLFLHIARIVGDHVYDLSGLRGLVSGLRREWHGIEQGVKELKRDYHGIDTEVRKLERDVARGIGNDARTAIRGLERRVGEIESRALPGIRAGIREAEHEVTALEQYIRANYLSKATDAIAAAVAVALAALGLGGLRCGSLSNLLNKRACGLWGALDDLLGLFADAVLFADLCAVLPEVTGLFQDFEEPLTALIAGAADAACAKPPSGWVKLDVANGPLPPAQTLGTLPS